MSAALQALRARTSAAGCSAALVLNPINIRYLTGYHSNAYSRPLTLVVPVDGDPVFLVPRLEAEQARALTSVQDVRDYVEWADGSHHGGAPEVEWAALLADVLNSMRGRIAVEEAALTPSRASLALEAIAAERRVDATGWVEAQRIIKSTDEIENHRRAAALAGVGLDAAIAALDNGRVGARDLRGRGPRHAGRGRAGVPERPCSRRRQRHRWPAKRLAAHARDGGSSTGRRPGVHRPRSVDWRLLVRAVADPCRGPIGVGRAGARVSRCCPRV